MLPIEEGENLTHRLRFMWLEIALLSFKYEWTHFLFFFFFLTAENNPSSPTFIFLRDYENINSWVVRIRSLFLGNKNYFPLLFLYPKHMMVIISLSNDDYLVDDLFWNKRR